MTGAQSLMTVALATAMTLAEPGTVDTYGSLDCAILGDLARQHTVLRLLAFAGQTGDAPPPAYADHRDLYVCNASAQATSWGFSAAMAEYGMRVRWSGEAGSPVCNSTDLRDCSPVVAPAEAALTRGAMQLIDFTWRELQRGVAQHMPNGTGSDVSCFGIQSLTSSFGSDEGLQGEVGRTGPG